MREHPRRRRPTVAGHRPAEQPATLAESGPATPLPDVPAPEDRTVWVPLESTQQRKRDLLAAAVRLDVDLDVMRESYRRLQDDRPAELPAGPGTATCDVCGQVTSVLDALTHLESHDLADADVDGVTGPAPDDPSYLSWLDAGPGEDETPDDDGVTDADLSWQPWQPLAVYGAPRRKAEQPADDAGHLERSQDGNVSRETSRRLYGWAPVHDPRSRDFAVRSQLRGSAPLQDWTWERGPVLDQGTTPPLSEHDASSCTGMASVAVANCLRLAGVSAYARRQDVPMLGADDARQLYADAQQRYDDRPGDDYAGTSVLAVMKAGQAAGWWDGYVWAFGTRDLAQGVLQVGPAVVGVAWDEGMESPDADGVVRPGGQSLGGHAVAVVGLRLRRGAQVGPFFVLQQSRGTSEGDAGLVYVHHRDLAGLLHGTGEAAFPYDQLPASQ